MCFRSCWTSCKVFRIRNPVPRVRISDVYEGLEEETAPARFGGHALVSNEILSVNDSVSCSLRMNQRKYFLKGKQLLTLQTKKTTLKEPRLAVIRPKKHEKGGKRNHLPVVVRSTVHMRSQGVMVLRHM